MPDSDRYKPSFDRYNNRTGVFIFSRLVNLAKRSLLAAIKPIHKAIANADWANRTQPHKALNSDVYGRPCEDLLVGVSQKLKREAGCELLGMFFELTSNADPTKREGAVTFAFKIENGSNFFLFCCSEGPSQDTFFDWAGAQGICIAKDGQQRWAWLSQQSKDPGEITVVHPDVAMAAGALKNPTAGGCTTESQLKYLIKVIPRLKVVAEWTQAHQSAITNQDKKGMQADSTAERERLARLLPPSLVEVAVSVEEQAALKKTLAGGSLRRNATAIQGELATVGGEMTVVEPKKPRRI